MTNQEQRLLEQLKRLKDNGFKFEVCSRAVEHSEDLVYELCEFTVEGSDCSLLIPPILEIESVIDERCKYWGFMKHASFSYLIKLWGTDNKVIPDIIAEAIDNYNETERLIIACDALNQILEKDNESNKK